LTNENDEGFMAPSHRTAGLGSIAALTIAGALAGCATPTQTARTPPLPKYVAPDGVATAKLAMRASIPTGDYFGVLVYDDAQDCKSPRLAGAGSSTRNPTTVPLAAGNLQTLAFVIVKPNKESCTVRWSFTPQANKTYVVNGGALGSGCTAALLDASNPDQMRVPDGLVRRNAPGAICVPMAQATAVRGSKASGGQHDGAAVLNPNASTDDLTDLIGK
jgi:hypothetical protein